MEASFFLLFLLSFYSFIPKISSTTNVITTNQFITDGETVVSSGGNFEMGFFSPNGTTNRYIGIWYKKILAHVQTIVWVANRDKPLTNTSSVVLKVTRPGILALLNDKNESIWSTNTSRSVQNPVAMLLDSGNLVVKGANDGNAENFLWQSFDFPTDTHLPDMKLGKNFKTGLEVYLSAWKNDNDPTPGEYTLHIDPTGYPQGIIRRGTRESARAGPWNGLRWSGAPAPLQTQSSIYTFQFVFNAEEVYYSFSLINSSVLSRLVLTNNGFIQRLTWVDRTKSWHLYLNIPLDTCDTYSLCGAYGSCVIDSSPVCGCLDKFEPKYPQQWEKGDWSEGCVRKTPLDCNKEHAFLKYSGIKLPDTSHSQYDKTMTLEGCGQVCSKNCSCTAYSSLDISNGDKGCLFWSRELIDIRKLSGRGQDIYIRMDSSELVSEVGSNRKKAEILGVSFSLMAMILLGLILLYIWKKKKKQQLGEDFELPQFQLSIITRATNNFSVNNKIGEGGYGPVYKGVLEEGQEIAVKRLSRTSMQGLDEFKRVYSNEEESKSIAYFWDHFDKENYSIWFGEYKYNNELQKVFMSCNLISGMYQRLDKMRKQAFASVCLFGSEGDSTISGVWVWRGHDLAFEMSNDWKVDYDVYTWKKLDANSEETKKLVSEYFAWTAKDKDGRPFNQGKIFK